MAIGKTALSAKEYLAAQGIDRDRLFHKGKGEDDPIASNETESGRSTNRRVAIELSGKNLGNNEMLIHLNLANVKFFIEKN